MQLRSRLIALSFAGVTSALLLSACADVDGFDLGGIGIGGGSDYDGDRISFRCDEGGFDVAFNDDRDLALVAADNRRYEMELDEREGSRREYRGDGARLVIKGDDSYLNAATRNFEDCEPGRYAGGFDDDFDDDDFDGRQTASFRCEDGRSFDAAYLDERTARVRAGLRVLDMRLVDRDGSRREYEGEGARLVTRGLGADLQVGNVGFNDCRRVG